MLKLHDDPAKAEEIANRSKPATKRKPTTMKLSKDDEFEPKNDLPGVEKQQER